MFFGGRRAEDPVDATLQVGLPLVLSSAVVQPHPLVFYAPRRRAEGGGLGWSLGLMELGGSLGGSFGLGLG